MEESHDPGYGPSPSGGWMPAANTKTERRDGLCCNAPPVSEMGQKRQIKGAYDESASAPIAAKLARRGPPNSGMIGNYAFAPPADTAFQII
jgi:hypothetical protein